MTPPDEIRAREHTLSVCDQRLRTDPAYDPFRCQPVTWSCECGRRFEHVCDEAEACFYAEVEP